MIEREIVDGLIAEEKRYRPLFEEMTAKNDHWKDPFTAIVPANEFDDYSAAAEFYTGAPLVRLSFPSYRCVIRGEMLHVGCVGYYGTWLREA